MEQNLILLILVYKGLTSCLGEHTIELGGDNVRRIDRTGETFVNRYGSKFVIVEYKNSLDLWVEFCDEYKCRVHTSYSHCREGSVLNPYDKTIHSIGYLGLMKDGSKPKVSEGRNPTREYGVWNRMIGRCYSEIKLKNKPSYESASVCDRWLCFANFLEDLPLIEGYELWRDNPNQGIALDKDIKGNGSKIYCLENCCFITNEDNAKEVIARCGTGNKPIKTYGIHIKTGERTKVFNSLMEVERELGLDNYGISRCLQGKQKSCGGYKWYRVD